MKLNKYLTKTFAAAATLSLVFSCDTENLNELQSGASGEIGAYARIVTSSADKNTNLFDPASSVWEATIEFVDETGGTLIEEYSLYATFRDNTIKEEGDPDYSINQEVKIGSWAKASFQPGAKYPTLKFTVEAQDVINKLGLDLNNAAGGDTFAFRGEIKLEDGRMFTSTNTGKSITSELFYNDAFGFSSTFVCVPPTPLSGDWRIEMWDEYGDGWNGGKIEVTIDGTTTAYSALEANGKGVTEVIVTVPSGTSTLDWNYVAGSWESENTLKIYAPSGNLVLSDGPTPSPGKMALNLCNEDID